MLVKKAVNELFLNQEEIPTTLSYGTIFNLDFDNFLKACKICYIDNIINQDQYSHLLRYLLSFQILSRCEELSNIIIQDHSIMEYYKNNNNNEYSFLNNGKINNKFKNVLSSIIYALIENAMNTSHVTIQERFGTRFGEVKSAIEEIVEGDIENGVLDFCQLYEKVHKSIDEGVKDNTQSIAHKIMQEIQENIDNLFNQYEQRYNDIDACHRVAHAKYKEVNARGFAHQFSKSFVIPYMMHTVKDYKPQYNQLQNNNQEHNPVEDSPNAFLEEID